MNQSNGHQNGTQTTEVDRTPRERGSAAVVLLSSAREAMLVGDPAVDIAIEAICAKGCRQVRLDMERLEQGASLPETRALSKAQQDRLLDELGAIMAIYGEHCRID